MQSEIIATQLLKKSPTYITTFPKTFGSTSGPFGGIGGSTITTFYITAYVDDEDNAVLFCQGRPWKKVKNFRIEAVWDK